MADSPLQKIVTYLSKDTPLAMTSNGDGTGGTTASFSIEPPGIALTDIVGFFQQALGDAEVTDVIPAQLLGEGVRLTQLDVTADTGSGGADCTLSLAWEGANWELIPGLLSFGDPQLGIDLAYTPRNGSGPSVWASGSLTTFVEVAGIGFVVTVDMPSFRAKAEMPADTRYYVKDLLDKLGLDAGPFDDVFLSNAMMLADFRGKRMITHVEIGQIEAGPLTVQSVQLDLTYEGGTPSRLMAHLTSEMAIGGVTIDLSADHFGPGAGWEFAGSAHTDKTLDELAGDLGTKLQLESLPNLLPDIVKRTALQQLYLNWNTATGSLAFGGTAQFESLPNDPLMRLDVALTQHPAPPATPSTAQRKPGYDTFVQGQLLLGSGANARQFDLIFQQQAAPSSGTAPPSSGAPGKESIFLGVYQNTGGQEISLLDLVGFVSDDAKDALGSVGDALKFKIKDALFAYKSEPITDVPPAGANPPRPGTGGRGQFLFTMDMDVGIDLSGLGDLPLIGKALPVDQALKLSFQPIVSTKPKPAAAGQPALTATHKLSAADLDAIRALLPEGGLTLPNQVQGGFELLTTLNLGGSPSNSIWAWTRGKPATTWAPPPCQSRKRVAPRQIRRPRSPIPNPPRM